MEQSAVVVIAGRTACLPRGQGPLAKGAGGRAAAARPDGMSPGSLQHCSR